MPVAAAPVEGRQVRPTTLDGGSVQPRMERVRHRLSEDPRALDLPLKVELLNLVLQKAGSPSMTEEDVAGQVDSLICSRRAAAHVCSRTSPPDVAGEQAALRQAAIVPTSYKELYIQACRTSAFWSSSCRCTTRRAHAAAASSGTQQTVTSAT